MLVDDFSQLSLVRLRHLLANHFALEDIRTICFDIDIDYDDLQGKTKTGRIISLLIKVQHISYQQKLISTVARMRPNVDWQMVTDLDSAPSVPSVNDPEDFSKINSRLKVPSTLCQRMKERQVALVVGSNLPAFANLPTKNSVFPLCQYRVRHFKLRN